VAQILISGGQSRSIADLTDRALRAANGLRAAGIGEGDVVALLLRNDLTFIEATLAANYAGAYAAPINWHGTADDVGFIVRDSNAKVLVAHKDLIADKSAAMPVDLRVFRTPAPPEVVAAYTLSSDTDPADDWEDLVALHTPLANPSGATRASIVYTSGTTGRPKGVRREPQQDLRSSPAGGDYPAPFGLTEGRAVTALISGPLYHTAPNAYAMSALRCGASLVLQPRFDAEELLQLIERHQVSHVHMVPIMFIRLLRLPLHVRQKYDLGSLRYVVHGAAPCPPDVKRAMIEWLGPIIYEYYGSTETGIAVWHDSAEALRKPGTVGRPLAGSSVRIVDDKGDCLPPGEVGEVYLRSADMSPFTYIGLTKQIAEITRDDHVTVGDVGWVDEDGYLFLTDRKRDMIISGGVNIYCAEIEAALLALAGVKDCAVFGIPDVEFGESVCAYVEPQDGVTLDEAAIRDALSERLARYKIPKRIRFVAHLPREDSGKIFKRKLREPYWAKRATAIG